MHPSMHDGPAARPRRPATMRQSAEHAGSLAAMRPSAYSRTRAAVVLPSIAHRNSADIARSKQGSDVRRRLIARSATPTAAAGLPLAAAGQHGSLMMVMPAMALRMVATCPLVKAGAGNRRHQCSGGTPCPPAAGKEVEAASATILSASAGGWAARTAMRLSDVEGITQTPRSGAQCFWNAGTQERPAPSAAASGFQPVASLSRSAISSSRILRRSRFVMTRSLS